MTTILDELGRALWRAARARITARRADRPPREPTHDDPGLLIDGFGHVVCVATRPGRLSGTPTQVDELTGQRYPTPPARIVLDPRTVQAAVTRGGAGPFRCPPLEAEVALDGAFPAQAIAARLDADVGGAVVRINAPGRAAVAALGTLGLIELVEAPSHETIDVRTGARVTMPAKRHVRLHPSPGLLDAAPRAEVSPAEIDAALAAWEHPLALSELDAEAATLGLLPFDDSPGGGAWIERVTEAVRALRPARALVPGFAAEGVLAIVATGVAPRVELVDGAPQPKPPLALDAFLRVCAVARALRGLRGEASPADQQRLIDRVSESVRPGWRVAAAVLVPAIPC